MNTVKGKNKVTINQGQPFHQQGARLVSLPPLPDNPLVTVVVPSYNQGSFIEDTILSVLRQDYKPIELIIVDGGSKDNTLEILHTYEKDPRVSWISEPDSGPHEADNKGIRLAKGDLIGIQLSSDTYQPGAIGQAVREFTTDPALVFVGGSVQVVDVRGHTTGEMWDPCTERSKISLDEVLGMVGYPPLQASFFRRDLALAIGGLDEEMQTCHTVFFLHYMLEACRIGAHSLKVPNSWANFRRHPNPSSLLPSVNGPQYWREGNLVCKQSAKLYKDFLTSEQIKLLRRSAYYTEVVHRVIVHRQIFRAIPALLVYLWFGGPLPPFKKLWSNLIPIIARYDRLSGEQASRKVGSTESKVGIDARWYLQSTGENCEPKHEA